jgi:hypothetical protein
MVQLPELLDESRVGSFDAFCPRDHRFTFRKKTGYGKGHGDAMVAVAFETCST